MTGQLNPFAGLKRKRLPGMHLITACKGGMPLSDALAAYFFIMLHDKVEHECLIKKALKAQEGRARQRVGGAKSPEGAFLSHMSGIMESSAFAAEEWSYLDDKDVFVLYGIASTAIEQVQRWIAEGSHEPFELPMLGGAIVQRPQWAAEHFGTPESESRRPERRYVRKLLAEIKPTRGSRKKVR